MTNAAKKHKYMPNYSSDGIKYTAFHKPAQLVDVKRSKSRLGHKKYAPAHDDVTYHGKFRKFLYVYCVKDDSANRRRAYNRKNNFTEHSAYEYKTYRHICSCY